MKKILVIVPTKIIFTRIFIKKLMDFTRHGLLKIFLELPNCINCINKFIMVQTFD